MRWRISAGWLRSHHECAPAGIPRCSGACCYGTAGNWPSAAFAGPDNPDKRCGWLGDEGCVLSPESKPLQCHLYPLVARPDPTGKADEKLIMNFRYTCGKGGMCKGNHGLGPMLVDTLRGTFVLLFGETEFERIKALALAGEDPIVELSPRDSWAYAQELIEEKLMLKVPPRQERSYPEGL
jgi:hypothetical protein